MSNSQFKHSKNLLSLLLTTFIFISIVITVNSLPNIRDFRPNAATASQGPKNGNSFVNVDIGAGNANWVNPTNAKYDDPSYSIAGDTGVSDFLDVSDFGFNIPSGIVNSVVIGVKRYTSSPGSHDGVYLFYGSSLLATVCSQGNCSPTIELTDTYRQFTYTGSISRAILNSSSFKVRYAVQNITSYPSTHYLNSIDVTVNYTPSPATATIKANGSNNSSISIAYNTSAIISWTSSNADGGCSVAPTGWTGTSNSGISTGNLTSDRTYTLTCNGAGGSDSDSVTINVGVPPLSGGGSDGGSSSGGSSNPSPISGVPTLSSAPVGIPGISVKIDPKIVNFLNLNLDIPYLLGNIKAPLIVGGFGQEIEVFPGTKEYQIDVRGAKFKLGSQLKIQVGGTHTLLTKKLTIKTKAPKQPVKFGDLWLGDLKVDNRVDRADLEDFHTFLTDGSRNGDVNADRVENSIDWATILANFGRIGDR